MKFFNNIRSSQGEKSLTKRLKTLVRHKQVHNFNTAKIAGILFDASNPEVFRKVKEFKKYLTGLQIECQILGFTNTEEIPSDMLFRDNVTIFCKKDLDFYFRPSHPDALRFMTKKFDVLFELSLIDYFPLHFISSLSPASFKVGKFSENNQNLDLMIDIRSQPDVDFLIDQIKNYVSILNNS